MKLLHRACLLGSTLGKALGTVCKITGTGRNLCRRFSDIAECSYHIIFHLPHGIKRLAELPCILGTVL